MLLEIGNINPAGNVIAVHDMNEIRNFGYQVSPRNYIIDIETGLISALLNLYMTSIQDGLVIIRGCHFHYAQCLIRNIKSRKVLFVHYDEHVTNIAAYLDNPNLVNLHNNSALLDPMNWLSCDTAPNFAHQVLPQPFYRDKYYRTSNLPRQILPILKVRATILRATNLLSNFIRATKI